MKIRVNAFGADAKHGSISGIPAGAYDLVAWHRSAGIFRRQIKVNEGRPLAVDFVIPVKEDDTGETAKAGGPQ